MADQERPAAEIAAAEFADLPPGSAYMGVPYRIDAKDTEEIMEVAAAFAADIVEVVDRHPKVIHLTDKREALACMEHSLAISRVTLEQQESRRARDN